jgi:hypothetical protein
VSDTTSLGFSDSVAALAAVGGVKFAPPSPVSHVLGGPPYTSQSLLIIGSLNM